ncbi:hypothetical protein [Streptomyces sp. NPDC005209]|uniref:hypothetical protein n=1 Tax=Streptomyces sp. NPDC005209 TaxID=3156715 RepID=UPI0033ACEE59
MTHEVTHSETRRTARGRIVVTGVVLGAILCGAAATPALALQSRTATTAVSADEATGELAFTADDVRDLVARMKADGGADRDEIGLFESYAAQLDGKGPTALHRQSRILGSGTIVRKLIVAAFRHGGSWLSKILRKVSPKTSKFVGKNSHKIADAIDAVENWGEHALAIALVRAGVPYDIAIDLAKAIMLIAV